MLPEPTDFGRAPGSPSCDPHDPTEDSTLFSKESRYEWKRDKLGKAQRVTERKPVSLAVYMLTSSHQYVVDGSVVDSCITGLDVHERLVSNTHEHSLLHTDR